MKKTIFKSVSVLAILMMFFVCSLLTVTAIDTEYCVEESVKVSDFAQLKEALQNFKAGQSVVLSNNIEINDDKNDCSINISGSGVVVLEMDGKKITVNSKATKYLFNITGKTKLYFLNSNESNSGNIYFNTSKTDAALVYVNNDNSRIFNMNVKFNMGNKSGYSASETSVFCVNKAKELNLFGGVIVNGFSGGDGVKVIESATKNKLNFRIGGGTELRANRYPVVFNSDKINSVIFASSKFKSDTDSERVKVQSDCTLTVGDLWYSSNSSYPTDVNNGTISKKLKITALEKTDITANKRCDMGDGIKHETVLYTSGGHVSVCSICYMAFHDVDSHNNKFSSGVSAGCTTPGKTSGYICQDCGYSTKTTTPPKGHQTSYVKKVQPSCGVDGFEEHYYCGSCGSYFTDKNATNEVDRNSLIIKNNHIIEVIPAVASTCSEEGSTSGLICKTCPKIISEPQKLEKLSHEYPSEWFVSRYATCQYGGVKEKVCNVCGYKLVENIPRLSHNYNENGKCVDCNKDINTPDPTPTPDPDPNPEPGTDSDGNKVNCSCSCHKDGLRNFLFKIILFFQKIFRLNQYCKGCGAAHY